MKKKKKKTKLPKKVPITRLKKKLWELCKQIVRKRDGPVCFICGKRGLEGSGWHTGHLNPSSVCGLYLRYDLRNLGSSCYNCNINLGGNGAAFLRAVEQFYGTAFTEQLFKDKQVILKADARFFEKKIQEYEAITGLNSLYLIEFTRTCRNMYPPESYGYRKI